MKDGKKPTIMITRNRQNIKMIGSFVEIGFFRGNEILTIHARRMIGIVICFYVLSLLNGTITLMILRA